MQVRVLLLASYYLPGVERFDSLPWWLCGAGSVATKPVTQVGSIPLGLRPSAGLPFSLPQHNQPRRVLKEAANSEQRIGGKEKAQQQKRCCAEEEDFHLADALICCGKFCVYLAEDLRNAFAHRGKHE